MPHTGCIRILFFCWSGGADIGTLYLIATPIGNLEDITLRALRLLREVPLIAAEDTRHTHKLLRHYEIDTRSTSYHEHNKHTRAPVLLAALAEGDVALVSDAGTPGINDPGFELVTAAIDAGFPVVPIPGPSAPIAALVVSGIPAAQWVYLGYLPARSQERQRLLAPWRTVEAALVCFETPHRLRAALEDLRSVLGDRRIAVARELTKLHEQWVRGRIGEAIAHFEATAPRGEFTLVIEGYDPALDEQPAASTVEWQVLARRQLLALRSQGVGGSTAARQVARELNVARGAVYKLWTELDEEEDGDGDSRPRIRHE